MTSPDYEGLAERLEKYWRVREGEDGAFDAVTFKDVYANPDGPEAAAALRSLQEENGRMREALEAVLASTVGPKVGGGDGGTHVLVAPHPDALRAARAALSSGSEQQ